MGTWCAFIWCESLIVSSFDQLPLANRFGQPKGEGVGESTTENISRSTVSRGTVYQRIRARGYT